MNYFRYIFTLTLVLIIISCGTESIPEERVGHWQNEGLENQAVNAMDYSNFIIYVAAKHNMFKKEVSEDESQWINLNLEIKTENSEFGDVLLYDVTLFAVVHGTIEFHDIPENFISLYKSIDLGENWEPIQITLEGREKPNILGRIAEGNNSLYGDSHIIYKSEDSGINWEELTDISIIGVSEFLYVSKDHPNHIWTGGWNNIYSPYLVKSEDGGETWTNLNENVYFNSDATAYAATIHPENEETVLVGFGGSVGASNVIRKSTDSGETWVTVLDGYNIRTLENSPSNADQVFASGVAPDGNLFVAISKDYGDSWEIETYENSPAGVRTNDMIVAEVDGKETIYFGTNQGVYSYTLAED